jgi:hypothetical protein
MAVIREEFENGNGIAVSTFGKDDRAGGISLVSLRQPFECER